MTRFEDRVPRRRALAPDAGLPDGFALDELVETLVAVFRLHPHIGNVMNHICGGRWDEIDRALRTVLDPRSMQVELSPLAENIVELLWAERGITGRILKPCFCSLLNKLLSPRMASQLCAHVSELLRGMKTDQSRCDGSLKRDTAIAASGLVSKRGRTSARSAATPDARLMNDVGRREMATMSTFWN